MGKICIPTLIAVLSAITFAATATEPNDIRVAPLLQSKWGQTTHNGLSEGLPCFNRKTPQHRACGCVAVSFSQIMRFLRYPTFLDWDSMPLNTLLGVTEQEAETIGSLTYDLGKKSGANYTEGVTYITVALIRQALLGAYSFEQAEILAFHNSYFPYRPNLLERLVASNCNHNRPLVLLVNDTVRNIRHSIVIDGYGYLQPNGKFLVHAVTGAYGEYDGWFEPPHFPIGEYDFTAVAEVAYNLLPQECGTIVCGRILNPDGTASVGAEVSLRDAAGVVQQTKSRHKGIYSFVVANPGRCEIFAKLGVNTNSLSIACSANVSPGVKVDKNDSVYYLNMEQQNVGNSCDNDIRLIAPPPDAPDEPLPLDVNEMSAPEVVPPGGIVDGSVTVRLSNALADAEIRYTLDGSEPTRASPLYSTPFDLAVPSNATAKVLLRARAWHEGMTESVEATALFRSVDTTASAPTIVVNTADGATATPSSGSYSFTGAISVQATSATPEATIRYTLDGTEPSVLSPVHTSAVTVSDTLTFKARAWKSEQLTSPTATANFSYNMSGTPAVGDEIDAPMIIRGASGQRTSDKTHRYTMKGNQEADSGYYEYHSAWFRWTAPASGVVTFDLTSFSPKYGWNWQTCIEAFKGVEAPLSAISKNYGPNSHVSFTATANKTYSIVVAQVYDLNTAYPDNKTTYTLAWSMDKPEYPPPDATQIDLSGASVSLDNYVLRYTGEARHPNVNRVVCNGVILRENRDYIYVYENNVNAGKGRVRVTGLNDYRGETVTTFDIIGKNITGSMVAQIANQPRTGRSVRPNVTVRDGSKTLTEGVDYELTYADNVQAGTARAIVRGKGNYRGEVSLSFWIYKDRNNPVQFLILIARTDAAH